MVTPARLPRLNRPRLRGPAAPLIAGAAGLLTALLFALMPGDLLDALALRSGIADAFRVAQPPLGGTARAVLALLGGGGVALAAWLALLPLLGARKVTLFDRKRPVEDAAPKLRRADAHPDAPSRQPVRAHRDLGTPFLDVTATRATVETGSAAIPPAERDIPDDLDLPLAAFDPAAIPAAIPAAPAEPRVAPVSRPAPEPNAAATRIDGVELTPIVHRSELTPGVHTRPASVQSLLDRLERGAVPRPPAPRTESIEETLVALRRFAARAG